jgi:MSHA biogenesis protein MshO
MKSAPNRCHHHGFTLVELIMVIVIMGAIGGMVSVFMKSPIDAYFDSARRAALTDVADTVVRRMARDIQRALPNSINTSSDNLCLEFIPTKTGGRYRAADMTAVPGSSLAFGSADSTFYMLGDNAALPADQQIKAVAGEYDVIAISNMGFDVGDAYTGSNTAVLSGLATVAPTVAPSEVNGTQTALTFGAVTFDIALASPSSRFQVIPANEKVVAYVCSNSNLYRVASTTLGHVCPATVTSVSPDISGAAMLARNASCTFNYSGSDLLRNALVSMVLSVTNSSSNESIRLQHEVHVSNTP